jgi:hypothetical protein
MLSSQFRFWTWSDYSIRKIRLIRILRFTHRRVQYVNYVCSVEWQVSNELKGMRQKAVGVRFAAVPAYAYGSEENHGSASQYLLSRKQKCFLLDREVDRNITTLCMYITLEMNTCHCTPASNVGLHHTVCTVSIKCIFPKQNLSILMEQYFNMLATYFGSPRGYHHASKCRKLSYNWWRYN